MLSIILTWTLILAQTITKAKKIITWALILIQSLVKTASYRFLLLKIGLWSLIKIFKITARNTAGVSDRQYETSHQSIFHRNVQCRHLVRPPFYSAIQEGIFSENLSTYDIRTLCPTWTLKQIIPLSEMSRTCGSMQRRI